MLMAAIMKDLCFTEYLDTWSISQLINIYYGKVQDKRNACYSSVALLNDKEM